jgi:hypothetical protein
MLFIIIIVVVVVVIMCVDVADGHVRWAIDVEFGGVTLSGERCAALADALKVFYRRYILSMFCFLFHCF